MPVQTRSFKPLQNIKDNDDEINSDTDDSDSETETESESKSVFVFNYNYEIDLVSKVLTALKWSKRTDIDMNKMRTRYRVEVPYYIADGHQGKFVLITPDENEQAKFFSTEEAVISAGILVGSPCLYARVILENSEMYYYGDYERFSKNCIALLDIVIYSHGRNIKIHGMITLFTYINTYMPYVYNNNKCYDNLWLSIFIKADDIINDITNKKFKQYKNKNVLMKECSKTINWLIPLIRKFNISGYHTHHEYYLFLLKEAQKRLPPI